MISGAPILREPAGRRTLSPGDVVCFPVGSVGAHALEGPGRFVIFSTGAERGAALHERLSGLRRGCRDPRGFCCAQVPWSYWQPGEGTGAPTRPRVRAPRSSAAASPLPIVNVTSRAATEPPTCHGAPTGFGARQTHLGPALPPPRCWARRCSSFDPGEGTAPYH